MEGSSRPFRLQEAEDDATREKTQNVMNNAECGQEPSEGLDTSDNSKLFHLPDVDASKSDNLFICSLCNQTFESSDLIQIHMQSHTNGTCQTVLACDGEILIKEEVETETEILNTKRKYRCTLCPKIFYSKYNLDVHIRTHTGERPYECSMCGKCFGSSSNCRKHMKTHKVKDRNEIKEDVDFMNYVRVLSGDRPFECITCSKSYTCKSDAQKHLRVHTGRKPYNCSLCVKTFSCSSNLYTHMRRKHRESVATSPANALGASSSEVDDIKTEKMYRCIECNTSFETKSECENHMIVRHRSNEDLNFKGSGKRNKSGYKCTVCMETFLSFDSLLEHMMDHQRESLFMCSECGETFTRNKDLVRHMRLHNVEYPVTPRQPLKNCSTDSSGSSSHGGVSSKHMEESGTDGRESRSLEKDRRKIENLSTTNKINEQDDDDATLSFDGDNTDDSDVKRPTSTAPSKDDYTSVVEKRREDSVYESFSSHKSRKVDTFFPKTPVKMEVEDSLSSEVSEQSETVPAGPNVYFQQRNLSNEFQAQNSRRVERDHNKECFNGVGKIKTEVKSDVHEDDEKEEMPDVKACYRCLFCCEAFTCHSDLNEHVKLHAGDGTCQCPLCQNGFCCSSNIQGVVRRVKGENGGEGLSDDVDSRYECAMCEVTFQTRKPYIEHMRVHTKEKSFICYVCGKNFSRMKNLRQHFVGHTGERAFSCTECGKSFIRKVNLKNHMRIHTGEQPHKCSLCLKAYNSKYDLDTHMRSHTGEKPCPCPDCGKSFASNGHLHKHMKTHTVGGEESEYRCSVCYKNFFDNTTLRRHFMIHTGDCPFECTVCGKSFRRDIRLKYHMRIHTGDQPYKCSVCLKDCNSKYQMETHMRTHTGEKPFQCSVCDKSFQSKGSRNKHETVHLEDN